MPNGLPAIGRMALMLRAGGKVPLQYRSMARETVGPVQIWRDAIGPTFLYTAANWGAQSFYLEVYMRSTSAKALARLYDVTAGAAVANSVITRDMATDSLTTYTRQRSVALTLVDGHEYQAQFGVQDGGAGGVLGAKIVVI